MSTNSKTDNLARQIMVMMILGLVIGLILHYFNLGSWIVPLKPLGDIFIRLLKMVIVPLVFASIFMSMYNLGTPRDLGSMGGKAIIYYFVTTAVAVGIGLVVVNIINPGIGVNLGDIDTSISSDLSSKLGAQTGLVSTMVKVVTNAIPQNPFEAMSNGNVLQVIVFSILFGIVALYLKKEAAPFVQFTQSVESLTLALTHGIMKLAPIGIFVLMLGVVAKSGFAAIKALSWYMLTVVVGLALHATFLLILAVWRKKCSPLTIVRALISPLVTAFSTASSAATLPITLAAVQDNLGVKEKTAKFVLPLGATINMDGTALYESVAVIFIGQVYNLPMPISTQIIIFMTASLAAVGAAAIPGAGLITMTIVLNAVGFPIEGIGLILAVDRLLDMFRTAVNVFGDCVGTVVIDSFISEEDAS